MGKQNPGGKFGGDGTKINFGKNAEGRTHFSGETERGTADIAKFGNVRKNLGQQKTLKTKIPIERPSGRPSSVEQIMLNELIRNAAVLKGWLIVNNRIATGEAVNSIKIKIVRSRAAAGLVSSRVNTGEFSTGGSLEGSVNLKKAAQLAKATDVGFVRGTIVGVPHLKFALQGRSAGTPPTTAAILAWMQAKGVGFSDTRMSLSQQAFHIAQKIGREGTNPPHFSANIKTQMVKVSATRIVRNLARVFPKSVVNKYVNVLVALGQIFDNVDIKRQSPEQKQFEEFI